MPSSSHAPATDVSRELSRKEQKELQELADTYAKLRDTETKLMTADGKTEALPNNLYSFLLRLLADMHAGNPVTLLQNRHELTTAEAGRILDVSRQYVVQLLEKGAIPFHLVGTHRRLYVRDVLAYKSKRDSERREILNELSRREFASG